MAKYPKRGTLSTQYGKRRKRAARSDTAEVYGDVMFYPGHNEQLVGKAISGFRKDVVLATKLFIYSEELCGGKSVCEAVCTHLEKSLANLNTDYIDLLLPASHQRGDSP